MSVALPPLLFLFFFLFFLYLAACRTILSRHKYLRTSDMQTLVEVVQSKLEHLVHLVVARHKAGTGADPTDTLRRVFEYHQKFDNKYFAGMLREVVHELFYPGCVDAAVFAQEHLAPPAPPPAPGKPVKRKQ